MRCAIFENSSNNFWGHAFLVTFFLTIAGGAGWLVLTSYRVLVDLRRLRTREQSRTATIITSALGVALAPALALFARHRITFEPPYQRWLFLAVAYALVLSMLVRIALSVTAKE